MKPREKYGRCELCQRDCPLTFHHLIPKKLHRRTYFKKSFSNEELNAGLNICRLCHNGVHDLFDEMKLAKEFHSAKQLMQDPALQKHVEWVSKQKAV